MKCLLVGFLFCLFAFDPSIYEFKVNALDQHGQINFADFKGKKILVVNTASKSPYRGQLEELQKLSRAYQGKLVVVGFPAGDDFGDQEFNTNNEIRDFCQYTYSITFPMSEKVSAVGADRHPVFTYLVEEAKKMGFDEPVIKWNFTKFLLDENGKLLTVFPADINPMNPELTSYLNNSRKFGSF